MVCVEGILWEQEEIVFILIRDWQLWHIYVEFYHKTTQEFGEWYDKTSAGIAKVSQEEAQWNP